MGFSYQIENARTSHAWLNVATAFCTNFLSAGFAFYSFGVVVETLSLEFPSSGRLGVSLIPMCMLMTMGLVAPFLGKWIPRLSLKNLMASGCFVGAIGLLLCARATELWHIYLIFGTFMAYSGQTMSGLTTQVLIINWFDKNRALALGISLLGLSASGIVTPHIAVVIGGDGGWRSIYEFFGWILLFACPLVWFVVMGKPELPEVSEVHTPSLPPPISLRRIYKDWVVWIVALPVGIAFMSGSAMLVHAFSFAKDLGLTDKEAAWFISAVAGGAATGKIFFALLAQWMSIKAAFTMSLLFQLIGFIGLSTSTHEMTLILATVAIGLGFGGITPLVSMILADIYGRKHIGPVLGAVDPLFTAFLAVGAPLAGYVFDRYGSYDAAFWIFGSMIVLAITLMSRIPKVHPDIAQIYR